MFSLWAFLHHGAFCESWYQNCNRTSVNISLCVDFRGLGISHNYVAERANSAPEYGYEQNGDGEWIFVNGCGWLVLGCANWLQIHVVQKPLKPHVNYSWYFYNNGCNNVTSYDCFYIIYRWLISVSGQCFNSQNLFFSSLKWSWCHRLNWI